MAMQQALIFGLGAPAPAPPPAPPAATDLFTYDYAGLDPDPLLNEGTDILAYYAAGADGQGVVGPSRGVTHQSGFYRYLDYPAGGLANSANSPSAPWVLLGWDGVAGSATVTKYINVPAGWTTFFSFAYQSGLNVTVSIFDGLNGTGTLLATQVFGSTSIVAATPTRQDWAFAELTFAGTAKSVVFQMNNLQTAIDSLCFGNVGVYANLPALTSDISAAGGTSTVTFKTDGSITATGLGAASFLGMWASHLTASFGNAYWVRCTVLAGSVASGTTGSWLALTSDRAWTVTAANTRLKFEIASDSGGVTVVAATANNTPERNHVFFQA